ASIARRGFLPGEDRPWVDERRRELTEVRLRALLCLWRGFAALGTARRSGEVRPGSRRARAVSRERLPAGVWGGRAGSGHGGGGAQGIRPMPPLARRRARRISLA